MLHRILLLTVTLSFSTIYAQVATSLNTLTGNQHTRIAWIQGGDRLLGGGALMGYDSKTDATLQILAAATNQNKPIICTGGHRIIVTIGSDVCVIGWDGSSKRKIATGIASDVWVEPSTGLEWVVVRTSRTTSSGQVYRYPIDANDSPVLLWNTTGVGDAYMNWYQISADGKVAFDFLPWDKCFVVDNGAFMTNGTATWISHGCWSSLAPDNSYYSIHFKENHSSLAVYKNKDSVAVVPITAPRPAGTTTEYYHPKFASNGAQFITLTGGYTSSANSDLAEIYIGKFAPDYKSISGYVRVTTNSSADYTADAWVGVTAPTPIINISSDSVLFEAQQGGANPAPKVDTVSTPFETFTSVTATTDASWLTVTSSGSGNTFTINNQAVTTGLTSGIYRATVTVKAPNAVPAVRTYIVKLTVLGTPVATTVKINPASAVMLISDSTKFTAAVYDQCERLLSPQPTINWTASAGTISPAGATVTFKSATTPGLSIITAKSGSIQGTANANVVTFIPFQLKVNGGDNSPGFLPGWDGDGKYLIPGKEGANFPTSLPAYNFSKLTTNPPVEIFNSFRSGQVGYNFSQVPNGTYTMRFYFIEPWDATGNRALGIIAEGKKIVTGYSAFLSAGKNYGTMKEVTDVKVTDGNGLQISLVKEGIQDPLINGLEFFSSGTNTVTLSQPTGGSVYKTGDFVTIKWSATDDVIGVGVKVSPDNGKTWQPISPTILRLIDNNTKTNPSWGAFVWNVQSIIDGTSLISNQVQFRIESYQNATIGDQTSIVSTIVQGTSILRGLHNRAHDYFHFERNGILRVSVPENLPFTVELLSVDGRLAATYKGKGNMVVRLPYQVSNGIYIASYRVAGSIRDRKRVVLSR